MKYIKFTDWQELGLKKDVEEINKKLKETESVYLSICWEIVFSIGSIVIGFSIDDSFLQLIIVVILALVAVIPPIFLLGCNLFKFFKKIHTAHKGNLNLSNRIDIFDNKICCWTMMSSSYADTLNSSYNDITESEQLFLYQEINYYINKSIEELYYNLPVVNKVFSDNSDKVKQQKIISLTRLYNIILILEDTRPIIEINDNSFEKASQCFILINNPSENSPTKIEIKMNDQNKEIIKFQENINSLYKDNLSDLKSKISDKFDNSCLFKLDS